jgi:D-lactate dehydrogenase
MKVIMFSTHAFERVSFGLANADLRHDLTFEPARLTAATAAAAKGFPVVSTLTNDSLDAGVLETLSAGGTELIALRCKGFNNIDLAAAKRLGLRVVRVPSYSPYCVAEHAFALLLAVIRQIPASVNRNQDENFTIEGLVGFELHGKTFGIIGAGQIGRATAAIAQGFGCKVIAYDISPPEAAAGADISYLPLDAVIATADILSLHAPLTAQTRHMIDAARIAQMKRGAIIVNTARGALIDTAALIEALKSGQLGGACLDVYELEESAFDHDFSGEVLSDDVLARLLTLNTVLVTSHRGFLTREALKDIAETTLSSLTDFERHAPLACEVQAQG